MPRKRLMIVRGPVRAAQERADRTGIRLTVDGSSIIHRLETANRVLDRSS